MNTKMNGRIIKSFRCYDECGNPQDVFIGHAKRLVANIYLDATHHGDHDQFWVVEVSRHGEVYHNPRALDFIEFVPEN